MIYIEEKLTFFLVICIIDLYSELLNNLYIRKYTDF